MMKLHNRQGFINSAPEGQAKNTNKPRFTQWLYFILLAFMIGYIIYLIAKPYFVIATNGIVTVESKYVYADRAGLVKKVTATSEQLFKQGTPLITLSPEKQCIEAPDSRLEKLHYDIEVAKAKGVMLIKEKEYLKSILSNPVTIQRALEINSSLFIEQDTQKLNQEKQAKILEYEIEQNVAQIEAMNNRLMNLKKERDDALPNPECLDKAIYAPNDGQVLSVNVDNATYVKKGDTMITYREMEPLVNVVMLADIEKDTVDFRPNYDDTTTEPSVLPTILPQLLLNGTMGIAVGMATNIPPHNLNEVVDATLHTLRNPDCTIDDLLTFIKGPDFPTGGEN